MKETSLHNVKSVEIQIGTQLPMRPYRRRRLSNIYKANTPTSTPQLSVVPEPDASVRRRSINCLISSCNRLQRPSSEKRGSMCGWHSANYWLMVRSATALPRMCALVAYLQDKSTKVPPPRRAASNELRLHPEWTDQLLHWFWTSKAQQSYVVPGGDL